MAVKPISLTLQKCRTVTVACALDEFERRGVNKFYILAVDRFGLYAERLSAGDHLTGGGFAVVGIFVVLVVLANIDDRQLP